jgi:hypothetical protein
LQFNFPLFRGFAAQAYCNAEATYSLGEVLAVFEYYFSAYEDLTGKPHPPIKVKQIKRIIEAMGTAQGDDYGHNFDIAPETYEELIDKHFRTEYRNCDYNINHFFTGDIRLMRVYETGNA